MLSRIARIVALSLPLLLACALASAGGLRLHDGRVERAAHSSSAAPAPVTAPETDTGSTDQAAFTRQLNPSVPLPAMAALIVLCILPAMATVVAWSGSRRGRESTFSTSGWSP